jgi:hypothetical protein
LLEGEFEGLTRKAVEMALAGDPTALKLCIERLLPRCRERPIEFRLPPLATAGARAPSIDGVFKAMNAVFSALACGEITPGEAERIAGTVETFARAAATTKREGSHLNMLQILTAGDDDSDDANGDGETGDDREFDDGDA